MVESVSPAISAVRTAVPSTPIFPFGKAVLLPNSGINVVFQTVSEARDEQPTG